MESIYVAIIIVFSILFIGGIVMLILRKKLHLFGGVPTDYTGHYAELVDDITDAFASVYPNITVQTVFDKLKYKTDFANKIIRELVYLIHNSGELLQTDFAITESGIDMFNETFVTLVEALVACYFERDCFLHDLKYITEGSFNSIIRAKCRKVGPKFDQLGIPNDSEIIIRVYKCKYNYARNYTRATKESAKSITEMLFKTIEVLNDTGRIYKPIYGSLSIPRKSVTETDNDRMTLIWHLYPRFDKITMPMSKEQVIDYLTCLKTIASTVHANNMVYGDWKTDNFMRYHDRIILTDIEMTDIDQSVQKQWLSISHAMPFDIKDVKFDADMIVKIDNFAMFKDACCLFRAFVASPDELVHFYSADPRGRYYVYLMRRHSAPNMISYGIPSDKLKLKYFTDENTGKMIDYLIKRIKSIPK